MRRVIVSQIVGLTIALIAIVPTCATGANGGHSVPLAKTGVAQQDEVLTAVFLPGMMVKPGMELSQKVPVKQEGLAMPLGILRHVPQQYSTIQAGINASVDGDTVLVLEGTYYENIKYRGKRIVVASVYVMDQDTSHISRTIIDGSTATNDTASAVCFVSGEDTNSVLCGFTIRGGFGTYIPSWNEVDGGGVFLWESGGRLVRNIITENNLWFPNAWGGGVSSSGTVDLGQMLIMEDNVVSGNSVTADLWAVGGGSAVYNSTYRLTGNVFEHNTATGGYRGASGGAALFSLISPGGGIIQGNLFRSNTSVSDTIAIACLFVEGPPAVVIDGNLFEDNMVQSTQSTAGGSAITIADDAGGQEKQVTKNIVRRNRSSSVNGYSWGAVYIQRAIARIGSNFIQDNTAEPGWGSSGGGIATSSCGGIIENNIITTNHAKNGGGISTVGEDLQPGLKRVLVNNTVCRNTAEIGGALWASNQAILFNNILWDDSSFTGEIGANDTLEVYYSNIQGGWSGGTGNINVNPVFADTLYRLADSSPCIGAGRDSMQIAGTWYRSPTRDFGGNPRPMPASSQPDMGAQENQRATGVGDRWVGLPAMFELAQNYPNPFNPSTVIGYLLPTRSHVTLKMYDLLGREVATLVDEVQAPGTYEATWDADGMASGVYFYRLEADEFVQTRRMLLLK